MSDLFSKSEKKRLSKRIEELVFELAALTGKDLADLPCPADIKTEIAAIAPLKGGARKRQVKFVAKLVRQIDDGAGELFRFLEDRKGSKLKKTAEFHELERLRDSIIDEAISRYEEEEAEREGAGGWSGPPLKEGDRAAGEAVHRFPGLDRQELQRIARQFARTRNTKYARELFRMLKAAQERQRFAQQ
jgi:ribosome-associated protein